MIDAFPAKPDGLGPFPEHDRQTRNAQARFALTPARFEIPEQQIEICPVELGLGACGIDRADLMIDRESLIEAVHSPERHGLVVERQGEGWPQFERPVEPLQRLREATEQRQGITDVVAGFDAGRIERVRPPAVGQIVLKPVQASQNKRTRSQCREIVRLQLVAQVEVGESLFQPSQLPEQDRTPVTRRQVTGVE